MDPDIPLKTAREVEGIRGSCRIAAEILRSVAAHIEAGVSTQELDRIAAALMRQYSVTAGVAAGFPGSICVSVNEVAAHGVPSRQKLAAGDLVTIDVAVLSNGWYGDVAASFAVGVLAEQKQRLLETTRRALVAAVQAARSGCRMGGVGAAVLEVAESQTCVVLAEFVGHGIGRKLHEEPVVPHTGRRGDGLPIVPGMVFTIEPALGIGSTVLHRESDGWSLRTQDRSPVAQFEHTVAVFADRTEVLTEL
ncbi:MAG: type I methionyl aminopeptidase [Spirochaetaceae bacterium]|nr:MAG: type I methionyl aminopeptidase [Spirochaetaceae bacterium]